MYENRVDTILSCWLTDGAGADGRLVYNESAA